MPTLTLVRNPATPNLPIAPVAYEARYNEQLTNVLRLYFNQLNTAVSVQTSNADILQAEIDALTEVTQRNQTLTWLSM